MLFKDMNVTLKNELKTVQIGDNIKFNVKQYLPAEDKNALLEIAMQTADQGTILNTFALDAIFHTYLVFKYTDIEFTQEEKENLFTLYDILEDNGIIDAVVAAIPKTEYESLRTYLNEMVDSYLTYRNSARALVEQFSMFAPQVAQNLAEMSQNIDTDKLAQVINLADIVGKNNKEDRISSKDE
jgi:hypothetical protein